MEQVKDPQLVVDTIDNEGWPQALEWLFNDKFEDKELEQIIYDATQQYNVLAGYYEQLRKKVESLGADWYIG